MWRIAPYADTSETTLRSTLRLVMTLAAAPAVFGAFWLAANSVPVRAPEPTTLRMSHSIIPGQRVTVSGNNYTQCLYGVAPGPYPSASGGLGDIASGGPVAGPSGSSAPVGPALRGRVRVLLDGTGIGDPVTPTNSGRISVTIKLPDDLLPGRHVLATQCERADGIPVGPLVKQVPFRIPWPSLQPSPGDAPPGGRLTLIGRGFWLCRYRPGGGPAARGQVRLMWPGRLLAQVQGAAFRGKVTVPQVPTGWYTVTAGCVHRPPGERPGPLAHAVLHVHGAARHGGRRRHGPGAAGPSGSSPRHQVTYGDHGGSGPRAYGHQLMPSPSRAQPAGAAPITSPAVAGRKPDASGPPLHLLAWVVGGSVAGLALLVLVLACWAPLARSLAVLFSRVTGRGPGLIHLVAKPGVAFRGRDDSVPTLPLHHGRGEGSFTIGIRARPEPGGWEVPTEALS